jgi:hypothetical protein
MIVKIPEELLQLQGKFSLERPCGEGKPLAQYGDSSCSWVVKMSKTVKRTKINFAMATDSNLHGHIGSMNFKIL